MANRVCYSGATVLVGDALTAMPDCDVLVEDQKILKMGQGLDVPAGVRVVDVSGKLLCPMFVDAHTHIGDVGAKELGVGLSLAESVIPPHGLKHRFLASVDSESHIAMMRHGVIEMLKNGIIAFADFREQGVEGVKALRQAAEGLPVRAVILGRMQESTDAAAVEKEARDLLAIADGLGVRDVTSYPAEALFNLRQSFPDKLFAAHAAENRGEEALSWHETGQGQVARAVDWGANFLIHLVHADPHELRRAAKAGVWGVNCPRSNGIVGDGFANLADWVTRDLPFALGTDNMMFCSPDMLAEMDFASRVCRGVSEDPTALDIHAVLRAATIEGARMLKIDDSLGSLQVGKEASFLVFDLQSDNLRFVHDVYSAVVHRATTADIYDVVIRGKSLQDWAFS